MIENQKFTGGALAVIVGAPFLIVTAALLGNARSASQWNILENSDASSAQPAGIMAQPSVPSQSAVTAYRSTERYYRDRHGAIVSETKAERDLEQIRSNIRSMPDNGERAYMEGVFRAVEEEWVRVKQRGPVEPLRAVDGSGKVILIGEAPLPESERRRIFYELVQAQDSGVGDRKAYTLIARKYGLAEKMLNEIAYEGAAKKWPMP